VFGFVGLGLMGGSFAKAVRQTRQGAVIYALDSDVSALKEAREARVIDKGFAPDDADEMLALCDMVFICLYPARTIEFLKARKTAFKAGAVVTDIAGVKTQMLDALPRILRDDVDFIPGHPMAGSEKEGYAHSSAGIFAGRNYIIMPLASNTDAHVRFFKDLITSIGFSRIIETDCATHDHKIAFTSQLCHVIACALVDSAEDTGITAFGGGSFEDLTRIAMINAPLWSELFLANKKELLLHITAFEKSLQSVRRMIEDGDASALQDKLLSARQKRIAMSRVEQKK
jgi:prephenate dehydrogenase